MGRRALRIGMIGSGFMGRAHALAFRTVPAVFETGLVPELELLADVDRATAEAAAARLGFRRATGDWRELVADPEIDLVDITAPNVLHEPIARAALSAGKIVYCEKPLAPDAAQARRMVEAARGTPTMVGFNYLKNPLVALAREIVRSGEIGEVVSLRGIHAEDYMTDPDAPWTWRLDPAGGAGALADLGSHIIALARFLVGPIAEVHADLHTVVDRRPERPGGPRVREVAVNDRAAALVRFAGGARGTLEASWVATGRKMQLAFEVTGSKGTVVLDHERLNELQLYKLGQERGRAGFVTVPTGPDHPPYGAFCPAPGHQLGFNDLKVIEVRDLLQALAEGRRPWPDFEEAFEVQRVVDAMLRSAAESRWVRPDEV
jgi:predicted dehydrogenase